MKWPPFRISPRIVLACVLVCLIVFYFALAYAKRVDHPDYGVSFNTVYARELGLNWKEVYDAILDDLGARRIRLAAHWNMVERERGSYNFSEMDYQVKGAEARGAEVIFALGKRLPRWPECHIPEWALNLSKEEQEAEILKYVQAVVERYRSSDAITVWQVENEPFLSVFAKTHCFDFDRDFFDREIELVRSLDDRGRPILVTDSGELSWWRKAFSHGDIFGTTMYVYSWNEVMGEFRNPFLPGFYSFRAHLWQLLGHDKPAIIAELALEPWLDKPVIEEQTKIQVRRMSPEKFDTVIEFAKRTGMSVQYLWGAEWWYYMKLQGDDWYWNRGKELFSDR